MKNADVLEEKEMKKHLYNILENVESKDSIGQKVDAAIILLILLNVGAVILESLGSMSPYSTHFRAFEIFSVIVFTVEYFLRLWVCTYRAKFSAPVSGRIRYMLTPIALVDLFAILPFYIPMVIAIDTRFLRALRLFRIMRLLKLGRYMESVRVMGNVLKNKKEELAIMFFAIIIMLIMASSLLYFVEKDAQPEVFSSIPAAMWWGIATLTTVGYGDAYPVTALGKLLAAVFALLGIGIFALPAGIMASGFAEAIQNNSKQVGKCPYCGKDAELGK